jgi:O-antigen/teichoic acid export membrane protein
VALGLAIGGAGYWAFAGGVLAGAWVSTITVVLTSPYKLRLRYDKGTLKSYADFSWPLFIANAASMVIAQSALIATNTEVGLAGVGVLALASNITGFTQRVDQLITGTLYPAICAVKDELHLLHESFVKSNRMALLWAMPFGTALTLFCADLVHFVIGDKWEAAIVVLQIYGLTAAIGHIAFNWDAYMRALGKTRPMAVASVVAMVSFIASLPLLFAYGLKGLAAAAALQGAAHLACRAYYMQRLFKGFAFWNHAFRSLVPTIPGAAVVLLLRQVESGGRTLTIALGELVLYGLITVAATWHFEGGLLREALGYLRNRAAVPA